MSRACVILVALTLAACGTEWGKGPDIGGATQNGVTIRYDSARVDAAEAEATARSYCKGWDREPKLRERFADSPDMTYAVYSCVVPAPSP